LRELNVPPENERAGGSPPGVPERLKDTVDDPYRSLVGLLEGAMPRPKPHFPSFSRRISSLTGIPPRPSGSAEPIAKRAEAIHVGHRTAKDRPFRFFGLPVRSELERAGDHRIK